MSAAPIEASAAIPAQITGQTQVAGCEVRMTAVYSPAAGRYIVRRIEVESPGPEITGGRLRAVPVAAVLREVVTAALRQHAPPHRPAMDRPAGGPTDETLRWVASVYQLAVLLGDAPTQAVAEQLDIPRSTAGRWVTRARDRGLLDVTDPRTPHAAPITR